jgi:uncharacterized protein YgiM (DUF1202 family)
MLPRIAYLLALTAAVQAAPSAQQTPAKSSTATKKAESFKPFTGKLTAGKVRVRAKADLESPIIRQMNKNDYLLVIGEENDFYAIEPLKDTKAYVFRSYILDGVVEANRVNVRLEPHIDAPIIAQLKAGDKVQGNVCPINHKWLEIAPPKGAKFYVAKEYVANAGGADLIVTMEKRKAQVEELLASAYINAEAECKKNYEEMAPQQAIEQFQNILRNFTDFPQAQARAKEGLALLKETYLNKKIAYLEAKAELSASAKQELLAKHKAEKKELLADTKVNVDPSIWKNRAFSKKEGLSFWDTMEESLYLSWSAFNTGRSFDDYVAEQKANASVLTGTVERYTFDVKNRPGDFILRNEEDVPVAYLYSTQVDLDRFEGKSVTVLASPRPNNHFAFPAYFVFSVE